MLSKTNNFRLTFDKIRWFISEWPILYLNTTYNFCSRSHNRYMLILMTVVFDVKKKY